MTLPEIIRIIEADCIMLETRIATHGQLPEEKVSKEAVALLEGSLLQNQRIKYLLYLLLVSSKQGEKVS